MSRTLLSIPLCVLLFSGCSTGAGRATNPHSPGPAIGNAVGYGVGAVGSNVVGAGVGVVEGAAAATEKTFNAKHRIVRNWKSETTIDGRTIRVPVEFEVDENGRVIREIK